MAPNRFQYAQLPVFQYQTFERQYQTFDPKTLQFSYHPILHTTTGPLTPVNDQDKANPETEKGADENATEVDGSSTEPSSSGDGSSPESDGKLHVVSCFTTILIAVGTGSWKYNIDTY